MRTKKVAVIDEHEVFRCGVVAILGRDPWIEVAYSGAAGPPGRDVDVIVASPATMRAIDVRCPVLVCWGPSDPPLVNSRAPSAIVERDTICPEDLLGCVWALSTGLGFAGTSNGASNGTDEGRHFDDRCRHILHLLSEGADTRGISESLFYSERTVKGLIRDIEERLSAGNRAEAVAKAIRLGLI